jgi:putative hydrolase of HD superfamily
MTKNNLSNLVNFFFEAGSLRKVARSHRQTLLTNDLSDNIASHSFRVTIIGYFLAKQEKANSDKVVQMCLFHDISEARCGDQNWVNKKYVKVFEDEIQKDQLKNLPNNKDLNELITEYQERKTLESKLAKDADLLDQILLLKEYAWQGNKEAEDWLKDNQQQKRLSSPVAKKLAIQIIKQKPSDWWANLWTADRR